MSDCEKIQESLAAGEPLRVPAAAHLERCAGCAALARDVGQLRAAARGLPRPPWPARAVALHQLARRGPGARKEAPQARRAPERSDQPQGALSLARAQLGPVLSAVALLLLLVGLALRFSPRSGPSGPEPGRVGGASSSALDLFAVIDRAQQVWAPASTSGGELAWLQLDLLSSSGVADAEIDPLASLRPAALLVAADARNGKRTDSPASAPVRGTNNSNRRKK